MSDPFLLALIVGAAFAAAHYFLDIYEDAHLRMLCLVLAGLSWLVAVAALARGLFA